MTNQRMKKAVALTYTAGGQDAPVVSAKGKGKIAEAILEKAKENGVPIQEDKSLVELLSTIDLNQQIPPELYQAVAEILAFVYRMDQQAKGTTMTYSSHEIGRLGESLAVNYLCDRGYLIKERNFRVLRQEVDIIAEKEGIIVFVEVKTRTNEDYGAGYESVNIYKQKHLLKAAKAYMLKRGEPEHLVRFDVISITIDRLSQRVIKIGHYTNAF